MMSDEYYKSLQETLGRSLDLTSSAMLSFDADEESDKFFWKEEDALNALTILNHVLGNIVIHKMMDMGVSKQGSITIVLEIADHLKQAFHIATGKNPKDVLDKLYPNA